MNRMVAASLVVLALGALGWLGVSASRVLSERRTTAEQRAEILRVNLTSLDGSPASVVPEGNAWSVLFFFLTECQYCRAELRALVHHAGPFRDANVVLVSPEDAEILKRFRREMSLSTHPHIRLLRDGGRALGRHYRIRRVPTVLVFDPRGRLSRQFEGLTDVRRIAQALDAEP